MISVRFQGKSFNITVIQVCALTSNAEEAEVEHFYEDLQDLLELTPKKDVLFILGDWKATAGSQETPGVTGKFGFGLQSEAGQRLIEFCQENRVLPESTGHSKHPLPTTQKKTLHMDTVSQSLLQFMSIESVMPHSYLILCHPLHILPSVFPDSKFILMSQLWASGGQNIGASASVLPMIIQVWFTLGLTDFISLQSKRLSRVFSITTVQKYQLFGTHPSLCFNFHKHA